MAIDPDVQTLIDAIDARLTTLENAPAVDTTALTARLDSTDVELVNLQGQIDGIEQAMANKAQLEADAAAVLNALQDPAKRPAIVAAAG